MAAHDRAPGREYAFLFSVPTRQKLALLDGDDEAAEKAFREASERPEALSGHAAERETLVMEGARLLTRGDPAAAEKRLAAAKKLPSNRMANTELLDRMLASARLSLGKEWVVPPTLADGEKALLHEEARLAAGEDLSRRALAELEKRASTSPGAGEVVLRLLEWRGRFPAAFTSTSGQRLLSLGRRAAHRAGLQGAESRFHAAPPAAEAGPETAPALSPSADVVAEDAGTRELFDVVRRVAARNVSVLVLGESGTGKEVVARALHAHSGRSGAFVAVNVAALPATLVESQLFGHVRGAFTGADRDREGLVEAATKGTLFLDEIGDLPLLLQGKLLRVLQEREVTRVGETRPRRVDVRVVAATHRDLDAMRKSGTFRDDLFHRLNGVALLLPPLRQRPLDLRALVERVSAGLSFTAAARRAIESHPWPGNVRELLAALESARALADPSRVVELLHLPPAVRAAVSEAPTSGPRGSRYRDAVDAARRRAIEEALAEVSGNRTYAARLLGLSRQSLLYEMKKLSIA